MMIEVRLALWSFDSQAPRRMDVQNMASDNGVTGRFEQKAVRPVSLEMARRLRCSELHEKASDHSSSSVQRYAGSEGCH